MRVLDAQLEMNHNHFLLSSTQNGIRQTHFLFSLIKILQFREQWLYKKGRQKGLNSSLILFSF